MSHPNRFQFRLFTMARALHWVFKNKNLKRSYDFFTQVLNFQVLRHEEFNAACEATCNGPYARPWSKTMVGPGKEDDFFVFELTYNYGIHNYPKGNDLRYIAVKGGDKTKEAAKAMSLPVNGNIIEDPDGYKWKLVENVDSQNPVLYVSITVTSLEKAVSYYVDVLGLKVFSSRTDENGNSISQVGFSESQTKLELVQEKGVGQIDHGKAFGRIAFASPDIQVQYKSVKSSGNKILHEPVVLPTPGKKSVQVVIVQDPDDYEICFVEEEGFRELSKFVDGETNKIDWNARGEMGADKA